MSLVNYATREITCKIVYYGPGRSGKTTNLHYIYGQVPDDRKGKLVSLATQTDRTLFFDFLPLDLGSISGFTTKFQLYTVPGQVYYQTTRRLVLQGADGIPSSYVRLLNSEIDVPDLTVQLRDTPEALYQRSNERGQYSRFHPVDPTASGAEQASYDRAFAELAAEGWSVALVEVGSRSVETLTTELLSLFTPLLR